MDIAIEEFFAKCKEKKLKKKSQEEVNEEYLHSNWLPLAAKRAGQYSFSTHPCKFSHPSSGDNRNGKTTAVIATAEQRSDGLVRSGNLVVPLDALGNAAVLDVYEFLTLVLENGEQLLSHIERDSEIAKKLLTISTASYEELKVGFLAMKSSDSTFITSSKLKQIYFPVDSGYHQLSILTASGVVFELHSRIQKMRFGEEVKAAREMKKRNEHGQIGFDDIYDAAMIGYGGTKPQNISALNKENYGKSYLLPSLPPSLKPELTRLPTSDFFSNSLWPKQFKTSFELLHKWLIDTRNNIQVRTRRDELLLDVFNDIVQKIWQIRATEPAWSLKERFYHLPKLQKIMLDEYWVNERMDDGKNIDEFLKDMARWMILAYKKVLGKQALALNDDELKYVYQLIHEQKEALS